MLYYLKVKIQEEKKMRAVALDFHLYSGHTYRILKNLRNMKNCPNIRVSILSESLNKI